MASTQSRCCCASASLPALCWQLCQRCAGVLARIRLVSSPALHCHCCQQYAGIVALVAQASLPPVVLVFCPCCFCVAASLLSWHLHSLAAVKTCWGMWRCCRLLVIANGLVPIPGVTPSQLGLQWSGQGSAYVFAGVTLASLPACCWHHCKHCAVIVASLSCWCWLSCCTCVAASIANWHLPSHDAVATCWHM
jgi:hypothetical protein